MKFNLVVFSSIFLGALSFKLEPKLSRRGIVGWFEQRMLGIPHSIEKRAPSSIAQTIGLDTKLQSATTEKQFDDLADQANNAYITLLNQDQDQSQAIALQNELTQIKTKISTAKNQYFINNPIATTPTPISPTPAPTKIPSQPSQPSGDASLSGPIAKYANLGQGLASASSLSDYDNLVLQINIAFQTLVAQDQSKYSSLQVELESLKTLIVKKKNASLGLRSRFLRKLKHFVRKF